jgi:hypothetical protein
VTPGTTVLGSGVAAAACALFAARHGPVRLCGRRAPLEHSVESVPAATLTLLLELGVTPGELEVDRLTRDRRIAWEHAEPAGHRGPASAHLDRAILHAALWERVTRHPDVRVTGRVDVVPPGPGRVVDATGRHAVTALDVLRPPRTWTAATLSLPSGADSDLHLVAAPDGYAYRLGSALHTTVGWVGPDRPPRDGAALARRIVEAGCGWLLTGVDLQPDIPTARRPAGLAMVAASPDAVPIGDAALARDALASQGLSLALSDACLAADPAVTTAALAARRADAVQRHLQHLRGTVASCRFGASPAWARYGAWLDGVAVASTALAAAPSTSWSP